MNSSNELVPKQRLTSAFDERDVSTNNRKHPMETVGSLHSGRDLSRDGTVSRQFEPEKSMTNAKGSFQSPSCLPANIQRGKGVSITSPTKHKMTLQNRHGEMVEKTSAKQPDMGRGRSVIICPTAIKKGKIIPPNVTKNVIERPPHLQGPLAQIIGIDARMTMRQIIEKAAISQYQKKVSNLEFGLGSHGGIGVTDSLLLRTSQIQEHSLPYNPPVIHSALPFSERVSYHNTRLEYLSPSASTLGLPIPSSERPSRGKTLEYLSSSSAIQLPIPSSERPPHNKTLEYLSPSASGSALSIPANERPSHNKTLEFLPSSSLGLPIPSSERPSYNKTLEFLSSSSSALPLPILTNERPSHKTLEYFSSPSTLALPTPWPPVPGGSFVKEGLAEMPMSPAAIAFHEAQLRHYRGLPDQVFLDRSNSSGTNVTLEEQLRLSRYLPDSDRPVGTHPSNLSRVEQVRPLAPVYDQQSSVCDASFQKTGSHLTRLVNVDLVRPSPILASPESQLLLHAAHPENSGALLPRLASRSYENKQVLLSPPYRPFSVSSFMSFDPHSEPVSQVTYNDLQMSMFGERLDPFLEQFFVDHYTEGNSGVSPPHGANTKSGTCDGNTNVAAGNSVVPPPHGVNTKSGTGDGNTNVTTNQSSSGVHTEERRLNKSSDLSSSHGNKEMETSTSHDAENENGQSEYRLDTDRCMAEITSGPGDFTLSRNSEHGSAFSDAVVSDVENEVNGTAESHQSMEDLCRKDSAPPAGKVYSEAHGTIEKCGDEILNCTSGNSRLCTTEKTQSIPDSLIPANSDKSIYKCKKFTENAFKSNSSLDNCKESHTTERSYKCRLCPESFNSTSSLENHEKFHAADRSYKCSECFRFYKDSSSLKRHQRIHSGKRDHKCVVCGKTFLDAYALESHILVHTKEKRHQCTDCGKCFSHAGELRVHVSSHTGHRPYRCGKCGKGFTKSSKLKVHQRSHTGERPFSCEVCSKAFTVSSNLKAHMRTHTGPAKQRCDICQKVFFKKDEFSSHMMTHCSYDSYSCDLCDKKFVELSKLEEHKSTHTGEKSAHSVCKKTFSEVCQLISHKAVPRKNRSFSDVCDRNINVKGDVCDKNKNVKGGLLHNENVHPENPDQNETVQRLSSHSQVPDKPNRKHQCEICEKVFAKHVYLQEHLNTHMGQKPNKCTSCGLGFCSRGGLRKHVRKFHAENGFSVKKTIPTLNKNVCDLCGKRFKQLCHLKVHKRIHLGEKPYLCEFCGKSFRDSGIRNRHVRIHTGEKPHRCSVCTKSFIDSGSLQKHIAVHTKPKQHICITCGKGFNFPGDLKVHARFHSGDKPFKCETCGKSFTKSSKLVIHKRTHSGVKPYKCRVCLRSFSVSSNLQAHMKTHANLTTFSCSICCRVLYSSGELNQHVRERHASVSMLPCPQCNKVFTGEDSLKEHMFVHTKIKPFPCSQCEKSFIRLHSLHQHQLLHNKVKSFHCEKCNSSFHRHADLQKHMRCHKNDSSPCCEECKVIFANSKDLHKHFCDVHTGGKFSCDHCSKLFRRRADMEVHSRTHTGQKPFRCVTCNKGFCGKSGLRKHVITKHSQSTSNT